MGFLFRLIISLVSFLSLAFGFSAGAQAVKSDHEVRQQIIDTAQCPPSASDLVHEIMSTTSPERARFLAIAKLRQTLSSQNELLACVSQLNEASDAVMKEHAASGTAAKVGSQVLENLRGFFRVLSSFIQKPAENCGGEGCAIGMLGIRG